MNREDSPQMRREALEEAYLRAFDELPPEDYTDLEIETAVLEKYL